MNKRIGIFFSFLISCAFIQAQNLDATMIENLRNDYSKVSEQDRGLRNAISNNDIKELAYNRDLANKTEHSFKYRVDVKGITDQKSSGRCWMFTGLNELRPLIMEKENLSNFEFSTNYLYFWDVLEKSNLFLEATLMHADKKNDDKTVEWLFRNPFNDGGVWSSFANIATKYGVVPKSVMPETFHSENTSALNKILKRKLRENGLKLRQLKTEGIAESTIQTEKYKMISEIYRMLVLFLGEPPTSFEYRFIDKDNKQGELKTYTPMEFFRAYFADYSAENYVMLMNDPTREYYKIYEIEFDRNVLEGRNWRYLNLPSEEMKKAAIKSIKNNDAMYTSCDVGKQLNIKEGTLALKNYDYEALFGIKFGMNKAERIQTYESGSSHAMLLVAVDTDSEEKPTHWQFENSWGSDRGHAGYLTFTDEWFDEYMFRIVVKKEYLEQETLKLLKQEAIMLPPWDPMFAEDK